MTDNHLTVVFDMTVTPQAEELVRTLEWVSLSHGNAIRERDRLKAHLVELAASQAREQQLREALYDWVRCDLDEEKVDRLLALPQDTTALEAMIAKAGEMMRSKAINEVETYRIPVGNSPAGELACEWTYDALKEIRDEIRALPGVTLEDMQ